MIAILFTLIFGWQLQGGSNQTVQVTERVRVIQPTVQVQEQPEEVDLYFQPVARHDLLNATLTSKLEVR